MAKCEHHANGVGETRSWTVAETRMTVQPYFVISSAMPRRFHPLRYVLRYNAQAHLRASSQNANEASFLDSPVWCSAR